jgi:hypothetical protein
MDADKSDTPVAAKKAEVEAAETPVAEQMAEAVEERHH